MEKKVMVTWDSPKYFGDESEYDVRDYADKRSAGRKGKLWFSYTGSTIPSFTDRLKYAIGRMWDTYSLAPSDFLFHFNDLKNRAIWSSQYKKKVNDLDERMAIESARKRSDEIYANALLAYHSILEHFTDTVMKSKLMNAMENIRTLCEDGHFFPTNSWEFIDEDFSVSDKIDMLLFWHEETYQARMSHITEDELAAFSRSVNNYAETQRRIEAEKAARAEQARIAEEERIKYLKLREQEQEQEEGYYIDEETAENIRVLANAQRMRDARAEAINAELDKTSTKALVYGASVALGLVWGLRDKKK